MLRRLPVAAAVTVALLAALPAAAQAAPPEAFASKSCSLSGKTRSLGPTYTTSLKVRRVSCRKGERIVKAYYKCRVRNGGKRGRCGGVKRFRCNERRFNSIRTQFDARVTCKRGRKVVKHTYTQFT
ncbi:MAG: hypothetical protein GXY03_00355 [Solirubrobacterales bacterium]|nr:hypothetical protein [Solirubrobacterales bacterium]